MVVVLVVVVLEVAVNCCGHCNVAAAVDTWGHCKVALQLSSSFAVNRLCCRYVETGFGELGTSRVDAIVTSSWGGTTGNTLESGAVFWLCTMAFVAFSSFKALVGHQIVHQIVIMIVIIIVDVMMSRGWSDWCAYQAR